MGNRCNLLWSKIHWSEISRFEFMTDEQLVTVCRAAQRLFRQAELAHGDVDKLNSLAESVKDRTDVFSRSFVESLTESTRKSEIYRNNVTQRYKKPDTVNAPATPKHTEEPTPTRDPNAKPYGTRKNVWLTDEDFQTLRDTFPALEKKQVTMAINELSLKIVRLSQPGSVERVSNDHLAELCKLLKPRAINAEQMNVIREKQKMVDAINERENEKAQKKADDAQMMQDVAKIMFGEH